MDVTGAAADSTFAAIRRAVGPAATIEPCDFADLNGYGSCDLDAALTCWLRSSAFETGAAVNLRPGAPHSRDLLRLFAEARSYPPTDAKTFFSKAFAPYRIWPSDPSPGGVVTGYYEPRIQGALRPTPEFTEPLLGRPRDLESFAQGEFPLGSELAAGRRRADGSLEAFPDRRAIEDGDVPPSQPLLWLRDGIEAFMIHVQGSARVVLDDGSEVRLTYAGRNGRPYTAIGRLLVERGEVPLSEMSLARLKEWVRAAGQKPGQPGRSLMQENQSFIFFDMAPVTDPREGPTGGEGLPLTPLQSIAVDRTIWPYGLPFWIEGTLPWRSEQPERFGRLMIAQDTGSAILGPARADLYFGTGSAAGNRAGGIRHQADFFVLLPRASA
eukprot:gene26350-28849_t